VLHLIACALPPIVFSVDIQLAPQVRKVTSVRVEFS
jgi:hypothetical protein